MDAYDRKLAYVRMRDRRLFAEATIEDGYGREYTYDRPYRYQARFDAAEERAQAKDAGLWGGCSNTDTCTDGGSTSRWGR
ncbi:thermonuclease family protein [Actinopolymorpha sp. B17G11]|uniref:thermonuclease family protein n=1 Tax=Actinopolymorpha sp. B17G11 TaxID=3160861 RepID=UPI0032E43AD2